MTQHEIDQAATLIRATPIEPPMRHLHAEDFDAPDPFWRCDFPGIVAVLVIVGAFVWAIGSLPKSEPPTTTTHLKTGSL